MTIHRIAAGITRDVLSRLANHGICGHRLENETVPGWTPISVADASTLTGLRQWIASVPVPASLGDQLLWMGHAREVAMCPIPCATVYLNENHYGVQFGYAVATGGNYQEVSHAMPVLDALAPLPGAWLHAGDRLAPQFIREVMQEAGHSALQLGAAILGGADGLECWLANHHSAVQELTRLALAYLNESKQTGFESVQSLPPGFEKITGETTPARQMAVLILKACKTVLT